MAAYFEVYDGCEMNLLALIIIFLAIVTAVAIAYIAWELSSGEPVFSKAPAAKSDEPADARDPGVEKADGGR